MISPIFVSSYESQLFPLRLRPNEANIERTTRERSNKVVRSSRASEMKHSKLFAGQSRDYGKWWIATDLHGWSTTPIARVCEIAGHSRHFVPKENHVSAWSQLRDRRHEDSLTKSRNKPLAWLPSFLFVVIRAFEWPTDLITAASFGSTNWHVRAPQRQHCRQTSYTDLVSLPLPAIPVLSIAVDSSDNSGQKRPNDTHRARSLQMSQCRFLCDAIAFLSQFVLSECYLTFLFRRYAIWTYVSKFLIFF